MPGVAAQQNYQSRSMQHIASFKRSLPPRTHRCGAQSLPSISLRDQRGPLWATLQDTFLDHGERRKAGAVPQSVSIRSHQRRRLLRFGRGQFIDGAFTNTAGTRTYKLYIPSTYAGQALPLVVMLHGCTQSPTDFAAGTRMNGLAERDEFFVVYPEQSQSANGSKCWNWFEPVNQQRDAGEPSLIAGITHKIMSVHHVNADRIYVVGMSAGGAMAAIMAAAYPDLYAAVGVHSGLAYGAAHDLPSGFKAMKKGPTRHKRPLTRAIPLITFHGDRDTTVARVNADHLRDQWLRGIEGGVGPANGVTIDRGHVVGGHAYTRFTHHGTDGRVILEEWIIHHAGHAWAGGSSNGSFTDPKGPDASAEMWRFFSERSRSN